MINTVFDDVIWRQAVDWLLQEQEETFDGSAHKALLLWLAEAEGHRQAYEKARKVWMITGLQPSSEEK